MNLIFLTGHRKSGTTLLHKLFDGHPELCVYPVDISLLYGYFPAFTADLNRSEQLLLDRVRTVVEKSFSDIDALKIEFDTQKFTDRLISSLKGTDLRSKKNIIKTLLTVWQEVSGADVAQPVVVKETSQSIYFDELKDAFPTSLFINLIRDPRDNYAALKAGVAKYYSQIGEGDYETLASLINRARMDFLSAALNNMRSPAQFSILRFEDLVNDPEKQMRKLAKFCQISFCDSLLQPTMMDRSFAGNSHDGLKFNGISNANLGRWRERILQEEAMIIEFWMGDAMERLGYERSFSLEESQTAFARFYDWYNHRYYYHDAFGN